MNFWKNPDYASVRVILLIAVVAVGGFFIYRGMHTTTQIDSSGRVINVDTNTAARPKCAESWAINPPALGGTGSACTVTHTSSNCDQHVSSGVSCVNTYTGAQNCCADGIFYGPNGPQNTSSSNQNTN